MKKCCASSLFAYWKSSDRNLKTSLKSREGDYRYGFNGKEKDNSFGLTNYDYGFRIYNLAIARFLSVNPLFKEYPFFTPYQYASNNPIINIDLDGLEGKINVLASDVSDGLPELRTHTGDLIKVIVENGNKAIQKPLEGAAVKVALKNLQKGRLLATDGKTFATSRIFEYDIYDIDGKLYKNVERGVNFGTAKTTTKGINQLSAFKSQSIPSRLLGISKFIGFVA